MKQYTFEVHHRPHSGNTDIQPITNPILAPGAWQNLSISIATESKMVAFSANELRKRWEDALAVCAMHQGEIISYASAIPLYTEGTRHRLAKQLSLNPEQLPGLHCYQGVTGWTASAWRGKGVYFAIRAHLHTEFQDSSRACMSGCMGLGVSPILAKLGSRLVGWSVVPFFSSLMSWFEDGRLYERTLGKYINTAPQQPYNGAHLTVEEFSTHPWNDYIHFWVDDDSKALRFEEQASTLLNGDIERWRDALRTIRE